MTIDVKSSRVLYPMKSVVAWEAHLTYLGIEFVGRYVPLKYAMRDQCDARSSQPNYTAY